MALTLNAEQKSIKETVNGIKSIVDKVLKNPR